jgi:hypothetical protein
LSRYKKSSDTDKIEGEPGQYRLILVAKKEAKLRARRDHITSDAAVETKPLADFLESHNVTIQPLYGKREDRLEAELASLSANIGRDIPDLSVYYQVEAPSNQDLEKLSELLRKLDIVEGAYLKPPAEDASMMLNDMAHRAEEPPVRTPNFTDRQTYLGPAPVGIDAQYAWTLAGGHGNGVNIIDIEWGWRFNHEDLRLIQGDLISGTSNSNERAENHGTAVIGEFSADANNFGVTGISSEAHVSAVSLDIPPDNNDTSQAIRIAADRLRPGDIILIEVHREGPASQGQGQFGYIAIEWWPDDYDAIRYAVNKGIIVVEAAGNGGQNLDDSIYNTPALGFPTSWRNPFNPANPSSGAIVVGAGNPPAGIHERDAHPGWGEPYVDRARCFFSNYGERVDSQGWGWEVTSSGYGDLQGGSNKDEWYGDQFSGTSSASPIIVGALACVQGILRANGKIPLGPAQARQLLRSTGSPQQDGPGFRFTRDIPGYPQNYPQRSRSQRIGNRPNLREMINRVL